MVSVFSMEALVIATIEVTTQGQKKNTMGFLQQGKDEQIAQAGCSPL